MYCTPFWRKAFLECTFQLASHVRELEPIFSAVVEAQRESSLLMSLFAAGRRLTANITEVVYHDFFGFGGERWEAGCPPKSAVPLCARVSRGSAPCMPSVPPQEEAWPGVLQEHSPPHRLPGTFQPPSGARTPTKHPRAPGPPSLGLCSPGASCRKVFCSQKPSHPTNFIFTCKNIPQQT